MANRAYSGEQIRLLLAGYGKFNNRRYGGGDTEEPETHEDVPDMTPDELAAIQAHMRGQ